MIAKYALSNGDILSVGIWSELLFNPDTSYTKSKFILKIKNIIEKLKKIPMGNFLYLKKKNFI